MKIREENNRIIFSEEYPHNFPLDSGIKKIAAMEAFRSGSPVFDFTEIKIKGARHGIHNITGFMLSLYRKSRESGIESPLFKVNKGSNLEKIIKACRLNLIIDDIEYL